MAYTMKKKDDWKDCGDILNKQAKKGDLEYLWGLRFYQLLIDCFKVWMLLDIQFEKNFEKIQRDCPLQEEMIYTGI